MLPLAFMAILMVAFGIGESIGGDRSGLMHLVPVILVGLMVWLRWERFPLGGSAYQPDPAACFFEHGIARRRMEASASPVCT